MQFYNQSRWRRTAGSPCVGVGQHGDLFSRFVVFADGSIAAGPGGKVGTDLVLLRGRPERRARWEVRVRNNASGEIGGLRPIAVATPNRPDEAVNLGYLVQMGTAIVAEQGLACVEHGDDPDVVRHECKTAYWIGSIEPRLALDGDLWLDTSTKALRARCDGSFTTPSQEG